VGAASETRFYPKFKFHQESCVILWSGHAFALEVQFAAVNESIVQNAPEKAVHRFEGQEGHSFDVVLHFSGNRGGLNGSTQHWLDVYWQKFSKLKSYASIDSNRTLPCSGLIEYSRTVRLSSGSIVGSNDYKVLRRPSEPATFIRH